METKSALSICDCMELLLVNAGHPAGGYIDLSRTLSSYIGSQWNPAYDHHSDRLHPKTGLLTLQQIIDYYTRPNGKLDFDHFTSLKDIATNCSMNIRQENHWKPKRVQPAHPRQQSPQTIGSNAAVEEWKQIVQQQRIQIEQQNEQIKMLTNALAMYLSK